MDAYAPMLERGTAIKAAIMLPKLATCMQSPDLPRNHDSEQPWKSYAARSKPIRIASSAVVRKRPEPKYLTSSSGSERLRQFANLP